MNHCVIIRMQHVNKCVTNLYDKLSEYFGDNVYMFSEHYNDQELNFKISDGIVYIGRQFLENNGLKYFPKCGWQCGDYILYAAAQLLPKYDYYWLVEPDLYFTVDITIFFNKFEAFNYDLIAVEYGKRNYNWFWYASMKELYNDNIAGCLFPFIRISKLAILFCFKKRQEYSELESIKKFDFSKNRIFKEYANDEAFVGSTLKNSLNYRCISMNEISPDELDGFFSTAVPILSSELNESYLVNKIIHPVKENNEIIKKKLIILYNNEHKRAYFIKRMEQIISSMGEDFWFELTGLDPKVVKNK